MSVDLKKQCQAVINIIKSQTDQNKEIGDQYILSIFENLNDADKVYLIKCITSCQDCQHNNTQKELPLVHTPSTKEKLNKEIDTLDEYNKKELIRLKVWGVQIFVLMGIFFGIVIVILLIFLNSDEFRSNNGFLNEIEAFYGYLTN